MRPSTDRAAVTATDRGCGAQRCRRADGPHHRAAASPDGRSEPIRSTSRSWVTCFSPHGRSARLVARCLRGGGHGRDLQRAGQIRSATGREVEFEIGLDTAFELERAPAVGHANAPRRPLRPVRACKRSQVTRILHRSTVQDDLEPANASGWRLATSRRRDRIRQRIG